MTPFDHGFLKQAQASGLSHPHAVEALEFYKSAQAPISGKGSTPSLKPKEYNQTLGSTGGSKPISAPGMQPKAPSPSMQSLQARQTLPMPTPQLAGQVAPQQGPPMPLQIPAPHLAPQVAQMQGPKPPMQMPQPQLAPRMAPGPLRPGTMPQLNQQQLAPR